MMMVCPTLRITAQIPPIQIRKIPIPRVVMGVEMPVNVKGTSMVMKIVMVQMLPVLSQILVEAPITIPAQTPIPVTETLTVMMMLMEVMPPNSKKILEGVDTTILAQSAHRKIGVLILNN
jgi:hypothetical protein